MNSPLEQQRRINTACGYIFVVWVSVTLAWVLVLLNIGLAVLFVCMALFGAVLALLRSLQTQRLRFLWVPVGTLIYFALAGAALMSLPATGTIGGPSVAVLGGMFFSFATFFNVLSLARHDFAKSVPAWCCRSCGYTLLGLRTDKCPECGSAFDTERVPDIGVAGVLEVDE